MIEIFNTIPSSLAIFSSALVAGGVGWIGLAEQRRISRQKNTLDFEAASLSQEGTLSEYYSILSRITDERLTTPISHWAKSENFDTEEASAVRYILNTWEQVGRGVLSDIYDDKILRATYSSTVMKVYSYTSDFVDERRSLTNNPKLYVGFQRLWLSWKINQPQTSITKELRAIQKQLNRLAKK